MNKPYIPNRAKGVVTISAGGRVNNARLKTLLNVLPQRAERVAETHAHLVAYWAREFAPSQKENDLGFIQNERHLKIKDGIIVQKIAPTRYAVIATAPQSAPQEFGSEPHPIAAKNGGRLLFYWNNAGHWSNPKAVRHPGNPPHPFMLPARRRVAATYYKALRSMFDTNNIPWQVR